MTNEQFEATVRRLDAEADRNPAGYRQKVLWLGVLGYGYVLFLLAGTLGLICLIGFLLLFWGRGSILMIKLGIPLLLFAGVVAKSLWVTFPKPGGVEIKQSDAPALWATIGRLRERLSAPAFHTILLSGDYNAAVVQRPRFGIFGWQENYLLIGLPLLRTLTKAQFDSVIAHEMGHLRGGHGKFGGWVYRVNATWAGLLNSIENESGGAFLVSAFFKWYAPLFAAYSFPLRRQDEYEADRSAAESTGKDAAASALALIPVWENYFGNTYWKPFYRAVQTQNVPPQTPVSGVMAHPLAPALEADGRAEAGRAQSDALREETTFADSHPALSDRLKSLGAEASLPDAAPAPEETALASYLSPALATRFAQRLDAAFLQNISASWAAKHREAVAEQKTWETLAGRVASGETLPPEDAWEYATLTEEYRSDDDALPLYREIASRADARPVKNGLLTAGALLKIGQRLGQKRDPATPKYLRDAIATNETLKAPALSLLYNFYRVTGEFDAARTVYLDALRHGDVVDAAEDERTELVGGKVRYLPHGLTDEQIASLTSKLTGIPRLGDVYLVRKQVNHNAARPLFVFAFTLKDEWRSLNAQVDMNTVIEKVEAELRDVLPALLDSLPAGGDWNGIALFGDAKNHVGAFTKIKSAKIVSVQR